MLAQAAAESWVLDAIKIDEDDKESHVLYKVMKSIAT